MTVWMTILIASAIVAATKLAGYLVPASIAAHPRIQRVSDLLTVALLASLVVTQSFASGSAIVIDARLPAVVVAGALFAMRVPFVVVVIVAALLAAGLRAVGWAA